jgi:hypothetical protein
MGLKFLRDSVDSANLVSMYKVDGQPNDWNFFSNSFQTTIPDTDDSGVKMLARKFSSATDWVQSVGLSDFAAYDQEGKEASNTVFPFKLRFQPTDTVNKMFPTELPGDDGEVYMSQLKSIPADTTLYDVYALDGPTQTGGKESLIGSLKLDG